ncbi:hypothetical protein JHK86_055496 [Glycine max]|nr:hypothetical protein JHK86_055496 [Glycine max]
MALSSFVTMYDAGLFAQVTCPPELISKEKEKKKKSKAEAPPNRIMDVSYILSLASLVPCATLRE